MATGKKSKIPPDKLELYEKLIATNPNVERKGDVHPYTSVNGHMFTYLDQTGTLGMRLPKDEKDYVTVPDALLKNTKELKKYLEISYEYTKTLKPK